MVLEVAILNVRPGDADAFEAAFLEAQRIARGAPPSATAASASSSFRSSTSRW
jgi:hypothetical protein